MKISKKIKPLIPFLILLVLFLIITFLTLENNNKYKTSKSILTEIEKKIDDNAKIIKELKVFFYDLQIKIEEEDIYNKKSYINVINECIQILEKDLGVN